MLLYIIYKLIHIISLFLPLKWGYSLASFLADTRFIVAHRDREALMDNLAATGITKDKLKLLTRECYHNFAKYLVDFFRFSKLDEKFFKKYIKVVNKHYLDEALSKGKGVIIISGHLGNWEMGGAALSALGYKLTVVALEHKHTLVNSLFERQRTIAGVKTKILGNDGRFLFEAFNRNELVAIVGDRDFAGNGLKIKFFNHPVSFPRGPAVFHIKKSIPIIPTFMVREPDDTYQLIFEPEIKVTLSGDKALDQLSIIEEWKRLFEGYVKRYPNQWFMFRRFWSLKANKV